MPHALFRGRAHGSNDKQTAASDAALAKNQYEASIFVGRRKVWSGRGATEQEAFRQAEMEKTKYANANPEVKIKKVKGGS